MQVKAAYSQSDRCFKLGSLYLRGLHQTIQACFFPRYRYKKATAGPTYHPKNSLLALEYISKNALTRGRKLDQAVGRLAFLCRTYNVRPQDILDPRERGKHPNSVERQMDLLISKSHPYLVSCVLPFLLKKKYYPVRSQTPVWNKACRLGSAVDLECENEHGDTVIIEIKAGFDQNYQKHTPRTYMNDPLDFVRDSPEHQHQLQLACTVDMYLQNYPETKVNTRQCCVLRCHADGYQEYPLIFWYHKYPDTMTRIWQIIESTKDTTRKQRKAMISQTKRKRAISTRPRKKRKKE